MACVVFALLSQTAWAQPLNDNWAGGFALPPFFSTTGNNINATTQPGEQNLTSPLTGATVWWFFTAKSNGSFTINTTGSNYDTVLHVFTDSQNGFGNFTLVASDDDSGGGLQSQVTFPVIGGRAYEIRVGGYFGDEGNIQLTGSFSPGGILLGDVNLDGVVSLLDVQPFVSLLTSGVFQAEADINFDGIVSLLDVQPFVNLLTGN